MKLIKASFFVFAVLFIFSCKKTDYNAMAKDLCACMQPLADINDKILNLPPQDTLASEQLIAEIERVSAECETCAKKLDDKYGIVNKEDEPKAEAAFRKACPDIAKIMGQ